MSIGKNPLFASAATGSGLALSLQLVNDVLQSLVLLCSLVLGVVGVVRLFKKKS